LRTRTKTPPDVKVAALSARDALLVLPDALGGEFDEGELTFHRLDEGDLAFHRKRLTP
jgi:hypothetical protein